MAVIEEYKVRSASSGDLEPLAHLIFDGNSTAHRHLDWRTPLEWIGYPPYFVIEVNGQIESVMACPPDPPGIAWIRVFGSGKNIRQEDAWNILWDHVRIFFYGEEDTRVCVITIHNWFQEILARSNFQTHQQIVMLTWTGTSFSKENLPAGIKLRKMKEEDIPRVAEVDREAFDVIWHNTEQALHKAFSQATLVTVLEQKGKIVGYQLSTTNLIGGHLARLAVLPELQGRGLGHNLVADMIHQFTCTGIRTITVNTQSDNPASLSLYKKIGFGETGERFPVYEFEIKKST